jgi:hypothetical protein
MVKWGNPSFEPSSERVMKPPPPSARELTAVVEEARRYSPKPAVLLGAMNLWMERTPLQTLSQKSATAKAIRGALGRPGTLLRQRPH